MRAQQPEIGQNLAVCSPTPNIRPRNAPCDRKLGRYFGGGEQAQRSRGKHDQSGTSVPLPGRATGRNTARVISNVFIHLNNDLPIMADLEDMPAGTDRSIRCTNVRTVDGKRPSFVHDKNSTFVFPLAMIRLIEVPAQAGRSTETALATIDGHAGPPSDGAAHEEPLAGWDDEPDEDLLARVRSV